MSKDGLRWHSFRNVSGDMQVAADTANSVVWDPHTSRYLAFTRRHCNTEFATPPWCSGNASEFGVRREVRSVGLSADFNGGWAYGKEVAHGMKNDELYSVVPFRSPTWRAGLFFGVASYYSQYPAGKVTCELVVSGDSGANWTRLSPHAEFIPLGKNGSFNSHTCFSANGLIMPPKLWVGADSTQTYNSSEVRFYFAGGNGPHSGPWRNNWIGLATAKEHTLAGLTADATSTAAKVISAAIVPPGARNLWVLLSSSAGSGNRSLTMTVTLAQSSEQAYTQPGKVEQKTAAVGMVDIPDIGYTHPTKVRIESLAAKGPELAFDRMESMAIVLRFTVPPGVIMFAFGFEASSTVATTAT